MSTPGWNGLSSIAFQFVMVSFSDKQHVFQPTGVSLKLMDENGKEIQPGGCLSVQVATSSLWESMIWVPLPCPQVIISHTVAKVMARFSTNKKNAAIRHIYQFGHITLIMAQMQKIFFSIFARMYIYIYHFDSSRIFYRFPPIPASL